MTRRGTWIWSAVGSLLVFGFTLIGVPAQALDKPTFWVVPGNERFTAEWNRVPGATSYQVEYSTKSSFSGAKKIATSTIRKPATGLRNGTRYYVRVRAYSGGSSVVSSAKSTVPTSHKPAKATSVKVKGAGSSHLDSVNVEWALPPYATKVRVIASRDNGYLGSSGPTSGKYIYVDAAASQRKATVNIPASKIPSWADIIGSRTANAVYVRVVVYNGSSKSQSSIAFGFASPPAQVAGSPVKIASWNIQSAVNDSSKFPSFTWAKRKPAIINSVQKADPDLLAVQEVTTAESTLSKTDDMFKAFADSFSRADAGGSTGSDSPASKDSKDCHLYYRSSALELVRETSGAPRSGVESLGHVAERYNPGYRWPQDVMDNYFAWAEFQVKSTKKRFYAVSVHLRKGSTDDVQLARVRAAAGIDAFIKTKPEGGTVPVVVMGDMNSDVKRYPTGAPTWFVQHGYADAAATLGRGAVYAPTASKNVHFGTSNNQKAEDDGGYPRKPFVYAYDGTRVDHIMVKGASSTFYDNQVVLDGSYFDRDYQGSDHNLQNTTVNIP